MNALCGCFSTFKQTENEIRGLLSNSFEHLEQKLHEIGHSFSIRTSQKLESRLLYNHKHVSMSNDEEKIAFAIRTKTRYHCSQGKLYYKLQANKTFNPHACLEKKSRLRLHTTKKQDCPSTMIVYEIDCFVDYRVSKAADWRRKQKVLSQLKTDLSEKPIQREKQTFVILSLFHNHSIVSVQLNQKVDVIIRNELRRIVMEEKNTNLSFIRSLLRTAVKNNIESANISRSFFPDKRTIRNYIAKYSFEKKKTKIDQEAVSLKVDDWSKSGRVFYRPYRRIGPDIEPMLFCYQAHWQDNFFSTYGSSITLMDAPYKTTKYSLPLFLLVTKTNVNFCPIGFFVVQNEDTRSIAEALKIFRRWNPNWKPDYFMVDYSEAEINAVNTVFRKPKAVEIKICSFHREQAWERWIKISGNLTKKDDEGEILQQWRDVARSPDLNTFKVNVNILQNSPEFLRNEKALRYFENTWLKVCKLWVVAFFDKKFLMMLTSNNGIESQNRLLKHSFLKNHTDKSLSTILEVFIQDYIPFALRTFGSATIFYT